MPKMSEVNRMAELLNSTDVANDSITQWLPKISQADDAAWTLANAFLVLTMQTGFGMLEAGSVSPKNVANIMVKNVVDVGLGGILFWAVGYGLSFGQPANPFCGLGDFFFSDSDPGSYGSKYVNYVFQFSFATAATTIVSGAVAERIKLSAYMVFSALNIFVYCIPASWAWGPMGWLRSLGFQDFAGGAVVHVNGGASALVAAAMLGPRLDRFEPGGNEVYSLSSPVTALTGTFMLWWAWMAFNCGSTFGVSGDLWKTAAKAAVNTINGSVGGSLTGICLSWAMTPSGARFLDIRSLISGILGGLVGVTSGASLFQPHEALIAGAIGGAIAIFAIMALEKLQIDDPVGAVPVHFAAGIWSSVAVGLFAKEDFPGSQPVLGLLKVGPQTVTWNEVDKPVYLDSRQS